MKLWIYVKKLLYSPAFWILIFATFLRLSLALVNREANDNHMEVVQRLLSGLSINKEDCLECFQPKFYYYLLFFLIRAFSIKNETIQIIFSQSVNAFIGSATLIFIWIFLNKQRISNRIKYLVFALLSFNPKYLGLNGQVSNDTLLVLLSILSLFFFLRYLNKKNIVLLIIFSVFTGLATITKINGLVLFISIFISILVLIRKENYISIIQALLIFGGIVTLLVFSFSPYIEYMFKYGSPVAHTVERQPLPGLIDETYYHRPGITSILNGYFTFRFFNLIQIPHSSNGVYNYPVHRTSLWSQLYARSLSVHFQDWPTSWVNVNPAVENLTRIILILGLVPLLIFLLGYYVLAVNFISKDKKLDQELSTHFVIVSLFKAFIILSTYLYRDFSFMKPIYLYPAILSFIRIFTVGIKLVLNLFKKNHIISYIGAGVLAMLIVAQIGDVLILVNQLR